jgi:hypothetical protein
MKICQLKKQTTENKSLTPMSPEQTSKAASDWPAQYLIICYKFEKLFIVEQYEEERLGEETVVANVYILLKMPSALMET